MTALSELVRSCGVQVHEIVVGMAMEIRVVTQEPGSDFELSIHVVTKEEHLVSTHTVNIPCNGRTLTDMRS